MRRVLLPLFVTTFVACGERQVAPLVDAGPRLPSARCLDNDGDGIPGTGDCSAERVTDCDDLNATTYPGAPELCNDVDDNCDGATDEGLAQVPYYVDADRDGVGAEKVGEGCGVMRDQQALTTGDCDDSNAKVHPGQAEACNEVDDDCNGQVDDGLKTRDFYVDADDDGFGSASSTEAKTSCQEALKGYAADHTDCDDSNAAIKPAATELCNKADDNCDGLVDNGIVFVTYYDDADQDGFGSASANADLSCAPVAGKVTNRDDCNDTNSQVKPGATEICNGLDDDCNGTIDDGLAVATYYPDADGDGYGNVHGAAVQACTAPAGKVSNSSDCNDANPTIKPGATELCDGLDNDCNGRVDDTLVFTLYYADGDGDGYGNSVVPSINACSPIAGRVTNKNDCNDANPTVKPGAPESCNDIDDNCNGLVDDGLSFSTYWLDSDGDGYGASASTPVSSCHPISGRVTNQNDCDDARASIHPGATEICNGFDDDCVGGVDNGVPTQNYYVDGDRDGHGKSGSTATVACSAPTGFVASNDDCNDTVATTYPGAPELCNSLDDNCDNLIDNGVSTQNYYVDGDHDGYGDPNSTPIVSCKPVTDRVANATDCNDANASIRPGASEVCNGLDDNCNVQVDEGLNVLSYWPDADADGFGSKVAAAQTSCRAVSGKVTNNTDCNDSVAGIHPGATEICNAVDDNCDDRVDEGLPTQQTWSDSDADGYGTGTPVVRCGAIPGWVTASGDCNDANGAVHPGAPETCNNIDDDCNTQVDEGNPGGGATCSTGQLGVCASGTRTCTSGALSCVRNTAPSTETCNGADDNCNGQVDEGFSGLGTTCSAGLGVCLRSGTMVCNTAGTGTTCSVTAGPRTAAACDGLDNDCDGLVDEPGLSSTESLGSTAWADIEVKPYYYSAISCAGGVNGSGTDTLAGGAVVMAGSTGGISVQPLTTSGAPSGGSVQFTSEPYTNIDFAQAGDGYVVAGIWATNNAEIDLFYVNSSGALRGYRYTNFKYPSGCSGTSCHTLDSLRVVRGNGKRVTVLWREAGTSLNFVNVEPCNVGGSWELRAPGCTSSTLTMYYFTLPNVAVGIGADSTHQDWVTTQTCAATTSQRKLSVAYLPTANSLKTFTMNEDGSAVTSDTSVYTVTSPDLIGSPDVSYFKDASNADQFFIAYVSRLNGSTPQADLDFWMTNDQFWHYAWNAYATQNGINSIDRVRTSVSSSRIQLSALRWVNDGSSFHRQVMTRQVTFDGSRTPLGSEVETPVTTGTCTSSTDCRPGDKSTFTNWLPFGRAYYSATGSTPVGSFESVLSCD